MKKSIRRKMSEEDIIENIKTRTQVSVAKMAGVSKQRIEQIIKKHGMSKTYRETHLNNPRPCRVCGKMFSSEKNHFYRCDDCRVKTMHGEDHHCVECGALTVGGNRSLGLCKRCYNNKRITSVRINVGCILRHKRESLSLLAREVSQLVGVSVSSISHYECGRSDNISKYEDVLNSL